MTRVITAAPVGDFKPVVVATTEERAWVKIDHTRTVIVNRNETLPGWGKYLGPDARGAKFESGLIPTNP